MVQGLVANIQEAWASFFQRAGEPDYRHLSSDTPVGLRKRKREEEDNKLIEEGDSEETEDEEVLFPPRSAKKSKGTREFRNWCPVSGFEKEKENCEVLFAESIHRLRYQRLKEMRKSTEKAEANSMATVEESTQRLHPILEELPDRDISTQGQLGWNHLNTPESTPMKPVQRIQPPASPSFKTSPFQEDLIQREEKTSYETWLNQTTTRSWQRKQQLQQTQVSRALTHEDTLPLLDQTFSHLKPISPPKSTFPITSPATRREQFIREVDFNHERNLMEATSKLLDQRYEFQKRIEELQKTPIDLTQDTWTITTTSKRELQRSAFDDISFDLGVSLESDLMAEYKLRRAREEEERRQKEILAKREKLRMLAEKYKREQEENRKQALELLKPPKKKFTPITDAEEEELQAAFNGYDPNEVVSEAFNIPLTRADLKRLEDTEWLNDEVVNFYMNILLDRCKKDKEGKYPKVHFFNSFFYTMLSDKGYNRVKKWTKKVDIFTLDKVVVPVHMGNHWCLAVINFIEKRFEYYDSLGGTNERCLKLLREYVKQEHRERKGKEIDLSDWKNYTPSDIPQQRNGYDCGVFMCKYADFVSKNEPFEFGQDQMQYFRKRIALDILHKSYSE